MVFDVAAVKNIKGKGFDFSACKAFETGEVYLQMPFNAYYTNLEIALMDAYFDAAMAYPMHFSDVDLTAKYDEILSRFLGKTGYASLAAMSGAYGGFQKIDDLKGWFAGL
jgi:iron complex transport system substrate-binding protein